MIHSLENNSVFLTSIDRSKEETTLEPKMTAIEFKNQVLPYKNKLFRFALSYLKSVEDAKDVVQEVFIKAWEYLSNKGEIRQIEAWCMTAVKNKCLDFLKRSGKNTVDVDSQFHLENNEQSPLDRVDIQDALKRVQAYIRELPQRQQEILHLRDVEGYSYKKIAEILKIEMSLVKVNIFRARQFIKGKMSKIESYGI